MMLAFTGCVADDDPVNAGVVVGDPLPEFTVTLDNGKTLTTQSLRGKKVVIEFFNTTCPDCRAALPVVNEVYEKLKDDPGIVIFAISREEDATSVGKYWKENGLTIPYCAQTDRRLYNLFATVGIPRTYIADESGIITHTFTDTPFLQP